MSKNRFFCDERHRIRSPRAEGQATWEAIPSDPHRPGLSGHGAIKLQEGHFPAEPGSLQKAPKCRKSCFYGSVLTPSQNHGLKLILFPRPQI